MPGKLEFGVWDQMQTYDIMQATSAADVYELHIRQAKVMEEAGASILDFQNSGPVAGAEVVGAVSVPVIGGVGGGPWLDGRIRVAWAAAGYMAGALDDDGERYANVARTTLDAITAYADDVRSGRDIKGAPIPPLRT